MYTNLIHDNLRYSSLGGKLGAATRVADGCWSSSRSLRQSFGRRPGRAEGRRSYWDIPGAPRG